MSGTSDISNLFKRFGGQPERYKELAEDGELLKSGERWPLLFGQNLLVPIEQQSPAVGMRAGMFAAPVEKRGNPVVAPAPVPAAVGYEPRPVVSGMHANVQSVESPGRDPRAERAPVGVSAVVPVEHAQMPMARSNEVVRPQVAHQSVPQHEVVKEVVNRSGGNPLSGAGAATKANQLDAVFTRLRKPGVGNGSDSRSPLKKLRFQ
jgi:hypothetical protein